MSPSAPAMRLTGEFMRSVQEEMDVAPLLVTDVLHAASSTIVGAVMEIENLEERAAIRAHIFAKISRLTTQG